MSTDRHCTDRAGFCTWSCPDDQCLTASRLPSQSRNYADPLRDVLLAHHPIMGSETGPFSGCRCGQVQLGQDVIAHVVNHVQQALRAIEASA